MQEHIVDGYKWVKDYYANTYDTSNKIKLYSWENIKFINTHLISHAANYHKQYGTYHSIDENKNPRAYKEFWDRWEYRRRFGIFLPVRWKDDSGGNSDNDIENLWIPPKMVGFLNFAPITRTKDPDSISVRDSTLNAFEQQNKNKSDDVLRMFFKGLSDKTTAEITYDFPDFWDGHYHTWLALNFSERIGLHVVVGKSRRKGFSYIGAWDAFDEVDLHKQITVLLIAHDSKYMTKGDGIMNMIYKYSDFINVHTDWKKRRLIDNETELKFGYRYKGQAGEFGHQSKILALSAADNPDCARGKMAKKIKYEECGTFPNLLETIEATSSTAESGGYTVGQSTFWGTVGSAEADYAGLSELYYNPSGYDCLAFNNVFDENQINTPCGLWFGHIQNYEGFIDKDGNSDIVGATVDYDKRKQIKYEQSTASAYMKWVAERAKTPREAFNRGTQNLFKIYADRIQTRLNILSSPIYKGYARYGQLVVVNGIVRLKTIEEFTGDKYHLPITDTNDILGKNYDLHGCIIEYEAPFKLVEKMDSENRHYVPNNLYYITHDPYATDKEEDNISNSNSLGVAYVRERTNNITNSKGDRVVASWIGRPATTDEYNEQLLLLCRYYNAQLLFENDRGQVAPYFKQHKATRWLQEEPEMISLKDISGKTGRVYGFSIGKNPKRKMEGAKMLSDHFGRVVGKDAQKLTDGYTNDIMFVDTIPCKRLLREALRWNMKGNFDCISAMIVGEFQDLEITDSLIIQTNNASRDTFFSRMWGKSS